MYECAENPGTHILKVVLEYKEVALNLTMEQTL